MCFLKNRHSLGIPGCQAKGLRTHVLSEILITLRGDFCPENFHLAPDSSCKKQIMGLEVLLSRLRPGVLPGLWYRETAYRSGLGLCPWSWRQWGWLLSPPPLLSCPLPATSSSSSSPSHFGEGRAEHTVPRTQLPQLELESGG